MERLRKRADFLAAAKGAKAPMAGFVLQARPRDDRTQDGRAQDGRTLSDVAVRMGFTVSRKVGNAVQRNRVRRRLREIVRLSAAAHVRPGHDYVLVGRSAALSLPFERLLADLGGAFRRVHARRGAMRPHSTQPGDTDVAPAGTRDAGSETSGQ